MSIQTAAGSTPASTVLSRLKARLVGSLERDGEPVDASFVRVVARPSPGFADYKPEEGVTLILHEPQPSPKRAGAGRHGRLVTRLLEVHVASQNLSDVGGSDETLVAAHLDLEEQVVDVLDDFRPADLRPEGELRAAISVTWVPGGADVQRQVKTDPGMALSVLLFEVVYQAPLQVNRDAGS